MFYEIACSHIQTGFKINVGRYCIEIRFVKWLIYFSLVPFIHTYINKHVLPLFNHFQRFAKLSKLQRYNKYVRYNQQNPNYTVRDVFLYLFCAWNFGHIFDKKSHHIYFYHIYIELKQCYEKIISKRFNFSCEISIWRLCRARKQTCRTFRTSMKNIWSLRAVAIIVFATAFFRKKLNVCENECVNMTYFLEYFPYILSE